MVRVRATDGFKGFCHCDFRSWPSDDDGWLGSAGADVGSNRPRRARGSGRNPGPGPGCGLGAGASGLLGQALLAERAGPRAERGAGSCWQAERLWPGSAPGWLGRACDKGLRAKYEEMKFYLIFFSEAILYEFDEYLNEFE
jgi:hypothetical protein